MPSGRMLRARGRIVTSDLVAKEGLYPACPECKAEAGAPCKVAPTRKYKIHAKRRKLYVAQTIAKAHAPKNEE